MPEMRQTAIVFRDMAQPLAGVIERRSAVGAVAIAEQHAPAGFDPAAPHYDAPALSVKYRTTALLMDFKPSAIFRKTPRLSLFVEPCKITRSTHSLAVASCDSSTASDTDSVPSNARRERVPRGACKARSFPPPSGVR